MPVIDISSFGGLAPSVSPRVLALGGATVANNVYALTAEFRPLATDRTVSGVTLQYTNPLTLYKQQRVSGGAFATETQGWLSSPLPLSTVKGQVDDDLTDRFYISVDDGSLPPYAMDNTGALKTLGVTPPSAKPTVTVTKGNKYTFDEDNAARESIPKTLKEQALAASTKVYFGNSSSAMTAGAAEGWLPWTVTVTEGNPASQEGQYAYCLLMSQVGGVYTVGQSKEWALDPQLNGKQITYGGYQYWAFAVQLQGVGYTINHLTLAASLKTIVNPDPGFSRTDTTGYTGPTPATQLFTDAWCLEKATMLGEIFSPTALPQEPHIAAINGAQVAVRDAVLSYEAAPRAATTKSYISSDATATATMTAAIDSFATSIVTQVSQRMQSVFADTAFSLTTLKNNIIALFPSTFTEANISGSSRLRFDNDGYVVVVTDAVSTGVEALLNSTVAAITAFSDAQQQHVVDTTMASVHSTYLPTFAAKLYSISRTSSSESVSSKSSSIVRTLDLLRAYCNAVTADYTKHVTDLDTAINNIFDEGLAAMLPTPRQILSENRAYLTTWVTTWFEESAPSLPSDIIEEFDADVDIVAVGRPANLLPAELQAGWRLYRSATGTNTSDWQLVQGKAGETGAVFDSQGTFLYFDKTLTSYTDTQQGYELADSLETLTWAKPPAKLESLVGMANGILAGFYDNVVCFSVAYRPHAWPVEYQLTVKHPIVRLGAFGANVVVLTRGSPYIITGSDPASMSAVELPSNQACVSKQSVVAIENGVLYASPDGLCFAGSSGVEVITSGAFTREDWQKLTPSSIKGVFHDGVYYFSYSGSGGGSYALDTMAKKLVTTDVSGSAMYVDKYTDTLYVSNGTSVSAVFGGTGKRTATYKTGVITLPRQRPFAWLQVFSDFSSPVTVKWYGDGVLRHTATVSSIEPQRLPPGRYLEHEVEISTTARVTRVILAGTTVELQQV